MPVTKRAKAFIMPLLIFLNALAITEKQGREGRGHGDYCDPCQVLGFISGRVTVTLIGNSDSCDVPPENKATIFENLLNTQTKASSVCRH